MEKKKVKITERGFAGHFCGASSCCFRRNTLIEYGEKRIVVSTVGNYNPVHAEGREDREIGCDRTYETMAFEAKYVAPYWEACVSKEYPFKSNWALNELEFDTDSKADKMHDKVVKEISESIMKSHPLSFNRIREE